MDRHAGTTSIPATTSLSGQKEKHSASSKPGPTKLMVEKEAGYTKTESSSNTIPVLIHPYNRKASKIWYFNHITK